MRNFPRDSRQLFILIVMATLAMLLRWVGVVGIVTGVLILLHREGVVKTAVFGAGASITPGLWMVQNWMLTGHPTGIRTKSQYALIDVIAEYVRVILPWIGLFVVIYGILYFSDFVFRAYVLQQRKRFD